MLSPESPLALGPGNKYRYEQRSVGVDYTNLHLYLANTIPDQDYHQLQDRLYLGDFNPFFSELEKIENIVPRFTTTEIDSFGDGFGSQTGNLLERLIAKEDQERLQRIREMTAQGECNTLVCYDVKNRRYAMTKPNKGAYREVHVRDNYMQAYQNDMLPLLSVHTHPTNAPFSPGDFEELLTDVSPNLRLVKGILVICPNIQMLALATAQTPRLSSSDAKKRIASELEDLLKQREESLETVLDLLGRIKQEKRKTFTDFSQLTNDDSILDGILIDQEKPGATANDAIVELLEQRAPKHVRKLRWLDAMEIRAREQATIDGEVLTNHLTISLGKKLNIKLYTSTDKSIFDAVSG